MKISISLKSAKLCRDILVPDRITNAAIREIESAISRAERVRPGIKKAKAIKAKKTRAKRKDTRFIRGEVMERSNGICECGCGIGFDFKAPAQLDHQFGRVRAKQSEANTWMLRRDCHEAKTFNRPSPEWWLMKFVTHAEKHGFDDEAARAQKRLDALVLMSEAAEAQQ